jgi:hypothetical protein
MPLVRPGWIFQDSEGGEPFYRWPQLKQTLIRSARKTGRSQPVDATPSDMDHFLEVVFYETRKTVRAFCNAED